MHLFLINVVINFCHIMASNSLNLLSNSSEELRFQIEYQGVRVQMLGVGTILGIPGRGFLGLL